MAARLQRLAAVLCAASAAVFAAMALLEFFYFQRLSDGIASMDWRPRGFYAYKFMEWLAALGPRGSETILVWHYLTFDLLFPALFSLTLVSLILKAGSRHKRFARQRGGVRLGFAIVLVLPYTIADYAQNLAIVRLLSNPLNANPEALALASALVVTKFALLAVPVIVIATLHLASRKPG